MPAGLRAHYVTSIDRIGLALGAGGALAGLVAVALVAAGGQRAAWALAAAWLIGTVFATIAIVGVAAPVWLALHMSGRRGPATAAATGAAVALVLFTAAQVWSAPAEAADAALYRLASALATSGLVALAAAAIGWIMQRIAYRRLM